MPVNGLRLVPPVSNTTPLPTSARLACDAAFGAILHLQDAGVARGVAARDGQKRTGAELRELALAEESARRCRAVSRAASIALRYAAIVSTLGGSAVNQRATLLPKACARDGFEIGAVAGAEEA